MAKRTASEKKAYHNSLAKPGAKKYDPVTGGFTNVSDFERGVHKAKADQIHRAQVAAAKKHKEAGTYRANEK